jgi:hypothetical protein
MTKHTYTVNDVDGSHDPGAWKEYQESQNPRTYDGPPTEVKSWATTGVLFTPMIPEIQENRESKPLYDYMFGYFPDAFLAEVAVSWEGNKQHNPGQPMHWARGKSTDHPNKAFRHIWDHATGTKRDTDGTWHLAKAIWRLKAWLQEEIEKEKKIQNEFK